MSKEPRPFGPPTAEQLSGIRKLLLRPLVGMGLDDEELDALDWLELSVLGSAEKCLVLTVDPDGRLPCLGTCISDRRGHCFAAEKLYGRQFLAGACEKAPGKCPVRYRGTVLLKAKAGA